MRFTLTNGPYFRDHLCETNIRSHLRSGAVFPINGKFRDECLNWEIFYSLREAKIIIEGWRKHDNTKRPHSALGYRPPAPETFVPIDHRPVMHYQSNRTSQIRLANPLAPKIFRMSFTTSPLDNRGTSSPIKFCKPIIFAIFSSSMGISTVLADEHSKSQDRWCSHKVDFFRPDAEAIPDGAILRIGSRRLRMCLWNPSYPLHNRNVRIFFNPDRVVGLHGKDTMVGMTVHGHKWERYVGLYDHYDVHIGKRVFGEWTYDEYANYNPEYNTVSLSRKFHVAEINEDRPPHFINCTKDLSLLRDIVISCNIFLKYEEITAIKLMIKTGTGASIFRLEDFPAAVMDMVKILETADVTDVAPSQLPDIPTEP